MKSFMNLILELLLTNLASILHSIRSVVDQNLPISFQSCSSRLINNGGGKEKRSKIIFIPLNRSHRTHLPITFLLSRGRGISRYLAPPPIVRRVNIIMVMAMIIIIITTTRRKICNYGLVHDGLMVRH